MKFTCDGLKLSEIPLIEAAKHTFIIFFGFSHFFRFWGPLFKCGPALDFFDLFFFLGSGTLPWGRGGVSKKTHFSPHTSQLGTL
jgi:hypothetical protein